MKKYFPLIGVCLAFALLTVGCSKEEIDIRDISVEELESSFVVLAENTVELTVEEQNDLVIQYDAETLVLRDDEKFANLDVGHHVISTLDTPHEQFLFEEVLTLERSGGEIRISKKLAEPNKAYREYYIDTEKTNLVSIRSGTNLETITTGGSETIKNLVANLLKDRNVRVEPKLILTGTYQSKIAHPNTVWAYQVCSYDIKSRCFDTSVWPNTRNDADKDGIFDQVEEWMMNQNIDLSTITFQEFSFKNFGIKDFEIAFSTKKNEEINVDYSDSPESIANQVLGKDLVVDDTGAAQELQYTYLNAPFFVGPFGFAALAGPISRFEMDIKLFGALSAKFKNNFTLKIGHIDPLSSPNRVQTMELINEQGAIVPLSEAFTPTQVDAKIGAAGSITKNIGVAIGAALTVGSASQLGGASGVVIETTLYSAIEGEMALQAQDILSSNRTYGIIGNLCVDFGVQIDPFIIIDGNLAGVAAVNYLFDRKIRPSYPGVLPYKYSVTSLLPAPNPIPPGGYFRDPQKGLCIGTVPDCSNFLITQATGKVNGDAILFTWDINNTVAGDYEVAVKVGQLEVPLATLSSASSGVVTLNVPRGIRNALWEGSLNLIVTNIGDNCKQQKRVVNQVDCSTVSLFETNPELVGPQYAPQNVGGMTYQYMRRIDCIGYCAEKGKALPGLGFLDFNPNDYECMNATGYWVDGKQNNPEKLYYWTKEPDENSNKWSISEWTIGIEDDKRVFTYNPEFSTPSGLAPCTCVEF